MLTPPPAHLLLQNLQAAGLLVIILVYSVTAEPLLFRLF